MEPRVLEGLPVEMGEGNARQPEPGSDKGESGQRKQILD